MTSQRNQDAARYMAVCSECDFESAFSEGAFASSAETRAKRAAAGHRTTGHAVEVVADE